MFRKFQRLNEKYFDLDYKTEREFKKIYPIAGYIFLLFTLLNYFNDLIPLELFDPQWEFKTIAKIVDTVWAPFLGFCLIFFTKSQRISLLEKKFLGLLSWLPLILGIIFVVMIPLILGDASRINQQYQQQFDQQIEQLKTQIEQVKTNINQASPQEIDNMFNLQNEEAKKNAAKFTVEEKKDFYLTLLQNDYERGYNLANKELKKKQNSMTQDSFIYTCASLLSTFLLINVWYYAGWTRKKLF